MDLPAPPPFPCPLIYTFAWLTKPLFLKLLSPIKKRITHRNIQIFMKKKGCWANTKGAELEVTVMTVSLKKKKMDSRNGFQQQKSFKNTNIFSFFPTIFSILLQVIFLRNISSFLSSSNIWLCISMTSHRYGKR